MKHKHHIIPKHMGGTDDPSNLIELSIEEHAEAHRILYEKYGKEEDLLAWRGLSGIVPKKEIVKNLCSLGGKKSNNNRLKNGTHLWLNSEHQRNKQLNRIKKGTHNFLDPIVREKQKLSASNFMKINNPVYKQIEDGKNIFFTNNPVNEKIKCPHCEKIGPKPQMKQWHFDKCKEKKN